MKNFKMTKLFVVMTLVVSILMINASVIFAATVTMPEVAEKFNNCKTVESYKQYDYNYTAKVDGNKFIIEMANPESTNTVEFNIDGTILSAIFNQEEAMSGLTASMLITDCVGQLHGYEDGELFDTLNSDQIGDYTVENEGFEINTPTDESYEVKIDINKKLPLADFSNVYITVEEFEDFEKEIISSDEGGSLNSISGPLAYYVDNMGADEATIYMGEKNGITDRTYNSILSFLEIMFDSNQVVEYFKSNYSSMSEGDKSFDGFNVDVDFARDEENDFLSSLSGYEITKVTVDKNVVRRDVLNETGTDNIEKTDENVNSNQNNVLLYVIIAIVCILIIACIIICLKKRNK